jgi:eukaryotic translation initiation factor 2C
MFLNKSPFLVLASIITSFSFTSTSAFMQGVSRPTKYHVLWNDDENMTADELEQVTYYLYHVFSRCTRSVSYPAPTYNAHLASYRARVYLNG